MELLTKLDEMIKKVEEKEKLKEKNTVYRPRKTTIDKIETRINKKIGGVVYALYVDIKNYGEYNPTGLFEIVTGIKGYNIPYMENETKEIIFDKIQAFFKKYELDEYHFHYYFPYDYLPQEKRLRMITEGKDVKRFTFVSKENREKLHSYVKNVMVLVLEELIFERSDKKAIVKNMISIHQFYPTASLSKFYNQDYLVEFLGENDAKEIMEELKVWYLQSGFDLFTPFYKNSNNVTYIQSFLYLFTDEERNMLKEEYRLRLEKDAEKTLNEKKPTLYALKNLKKDYEAVLSW